MEKIITCTICPIGCDIHAMGDGEKVTSLSGYTCIRGKTHAETEYARPVRILTTTVKTEGFKNPLLAVRSNKPLPKEKIQECIDLLKEVVVKTAVKTHEVIVENVCGTGIDIIASTNLV